MAGSAGKKLLFAGIAAAALAAAVLSWFLFLQPRPGDPPIAKDVKKDPPVPPGVKEPKTGGLPADQGMAAFFAAGAAPSAAALKPEQLVGTWTAEFKSMEIEEGKTFVSVPLPQDTSFSFVIAAEGDGLVMRPAGGKGKVRALSASGQAMIGKAPDGRPDLRLTLDGDVLIGFMEIDNPVRGRTEFHAKRSP